MPLHVHVHMELMSWLSLNVNLVDTSCRFAKNIGNQHSRWIKSWKWLHKTDNKFKCQTKLSFSIKILSFGAIEHPFSVNTFSEGGKSNFDRVVSLVSYLFHGRFFLLNLLTLVLLNPDIPCLCKQCRSRSVGFWRSKLILICTVCH